MIIIIIMMTSFWYRNVQTIGSKAIAKHVVDLLGHRVIERPLNWVHFWVVEFATEVAECCLKPLREWFISSYSGIEFMRILDHPSLQLALRSRIFAAAVASYFSLSLSLSSGFEIRIKVELYSATWSLRLSLTRLSWRKAYRGIQKLRELHLESDSAASRDVEKQPPRRRQSSGGEPAAVLANKETISRRERDSRS